MNALPENLWECEVFRPWDDIHERQLRARILRCQRQATHRIKSTVSDDARSTYWLALNLASRTAFAQAKPAHLEDVLRCLIRLFVCAGQFERWEGENGE